MSDFEQMSASEPSAGVWISDALADLLRSALGGVWLSREDADAIEAALTGSAGAVTAAEAVLRIDGRGEASEWPPDVVSRFAKEIVDLAAGRGDALACLRAARERA